MLYTVAVPKLGTHPLWSDGKSTKEHMSDTLYLSTQDNYSYVDLIKRSYKTLTGEELTGEQLRFLDFDEQ